MDCVLLGLVDGLLLGWMGGLCCWRGSDCVAGVDGWTVLLGWMGALHCWGGWVHCVDGVDGCTVLMGWMGALC